MSTTPNESESLIPIAPPEASGHSCLNIVRECIQKTLLVEQFLLPLLLENGIPRSIALDFKMRWSEAALLGKGHSTLRAICRRNHIPITPNMTDQDLRTAILKLNPSK